MGYHLPTKLMLITNAGLTPSELVLFMIYIETESLYGSCIKNKKTLAEETGLSVPTVLKAKHGLQAKKIIRIEKTKLPNGWDGADIVTTYLGDDKLFEELQERLRKEESIIVL